MSYNNILDKEKNNIITKLKTLNNLREWFIEKGEERKIDDDYRFLGENILTWNMEEYLNDLINDWEFKKDELIKEVEDEEIFHEIYRLCEGDKYMEYDIDENQYERIFSTELDFIKVHRQDYDFFEDIFCSGDMEDFDYSVERSDEGKAVIKIYFSWNYEKLRDIQEGYDMEYAAQRAGLI